MGGTEIKLPSVILSYDDGYTSDTSKIVDVLSQLNIGSLFFFIGERIKHNENMISDIVKQGFIVGNHTEDHDNNLHLLRHSMHIIRRKIEICHIRLQDIYNHAERVFLPTFRFPGLRGEYLKTKHPSVYSNCIDYLRKLGYYRLRGKEPHIDVDFNTKDGEIKSQKQLNGIFEKHVRHKPIVDKNIILLHDVPDNNRIEWLYRIIDFVHDKNFKFCSNDDIRKLLHK